MRMVAGERRRLGHREGDERGVEFFGAGRGQGEGEVVEHRELQTRKLRETKRNAKHLPLRDVTC